MPAISLAKVSIVVHLCAPNDKNGNGRRGYVAFNGSALRGFWSEDCAGSHAVPAEIRHLAATAPRINVSATELRSWQTAAANLWEPFCRD